MAPGLLSTGTIARIAGMHPLTLRRWVECKILRPVVNGEGKGRVFGWTLTDAVGAIAIARLRRRWSAQAVRRVALALARYGEDLGGAAIVEDARGVYRVLPDTGDLLGLLDGGQVRAVALAPIVAEVRAEARRAGIDLGALKVTAGGAR